jgi:serine O-acetyltransferase
MERLRGEVHPLIEIHLPMSLHRPMSFTELRGLIAADQFRYDGGAGWKNFFRQWFQESGFRFTVVMRWCTFLRAQWWSRWVIYHLIRCWHRRQQVKYSTYISFESKIGPGLYLGHLCCIVVNTRAVIGRDCTLSHGVTLGQTNQRSKTPGCPTVGDRVYLGCGSKILGGITLGDDSAVGPNSVVVKDVPPRAIVSGIPAVPISDKGSSGYVAFPSRLPQSTEA